MGVIAYAMDSLEANQSNSTCRLKCDGKPVDENRDGEANLNQQRAWVDDTLGLD